MTPASTGTEGRLGRLLAVHATASASASRSTRNFINASASTSATTLSCRPLPTVPPDRAGTHRTLGRGDIGCAPDPVDRVDADRPVRQRSARSTESPTVMIGFCSLRRDNPSSSSHLCKLWRTRVCAAQTGYPPVSWLWRTGGTTASCVHSPATTAGCPPLSTGCPPVIHRLSPHACGRPGRSPLLLSPEPSTARTQVDDHRWTTTSLSPAVHSVVHRVSPQPVGNWRRTDRSYPPTVDNELWTTSEYQGGHGVDPVACTMSRVKPKPPREVTRGPPETKKRTPGRISGRACPPRRAGVPLRCSA